MPFRTAALVIAMHLAWTGGSDAVAAPAPAGEVTTEHPRADVEREAAAYAEREHGADEQLAYRGSQGAQYTQAFGVVAITAVVAIALVVVILVVAL
jgi:hypothetical protein